MKKEGIYHDTQLLVILQKECITDRLVYSVNGRFGSQAALHSDINPTAASGAKPDVRE